MIAVIIPAYNCAQWIGRCMASVDMQDHPDVRVHVVDDASTDPAQPEMIAEFAWARENWTFTLSAVNRRAQRSILDAFDALDLEPDDVVVIVDGDDFLPHRRVLSRIAEVYEDPDVWFAYGNYEPWPERLGEVPSRPYPDRILGDGSFRQHEQYLNHPVTFRASLMMMLSQADYLDGNGCDFRGGYDRVLFTPMLELAGARHIRFVDEILYVYTAINPISDNHVALDDVRKAHAHVAKLKPYRAVTDDEMAILRGARAPVR